MDTSWEVLVNSLANSGVPMPAGISSVQDFTPRTLFSVCSYALRLIHDTVPFPPELADDCPLPDRITLCTELASSFNELGFSPELDFHKFLDPTEEDVLMLVRFLVAKLSDSRSASTAALVGNDKPRISSTEKCIGVGETAHGKEFSMGPNDLMREDQGPEQLARSSDEAYSDLWTVETRYEESSSTEHVCDEELCSVDHSIRDQDGPQNEVLQNHGMLEKFMSEKLSKVQNVDGEHDLLRAAVDMIFDGQHPMEFYIKLLNNEVEVKRHKLKELETEWKGKAKSLHEKKTNLEQSLAATHPDVSEKLMRKKETELETESVLAEIKRRDNDHLRLSSDLEKQPKHAPRKSYVERINEITKNSRKQDADIQRILKDTRELQLESNSIQERLNRTYAVVDETIFREAKKDPVARQAYRLLAKIHESFEQIAESILANDRSRREAADCEAKVATISTRSLDLDKLQVDLDAIREENDLLEQRLNNV